MLGTEEFQITEGSASTLHNGRGAEFLLCGEKASPECLSAVTSPGPLGRPENSGPVLVPIVWNVSVLLHIVLREGSFLLASTSSAGQEVARTVLDMMTHPSAHMLFKPGGPVVWRGPEACHFC